MKYESVRFHFGVQIKSCFVKENRDLDEILGEWRQKARKITVGDQKKSIGLV